MSMETSTQQQIRDDMEAAYERVPEHMLDVMELVSYYVQTVDDPMYDNDDTVHMIRNAILRLVKVACEYERIHISYEVARNCVNSPRPWNVPTKRGATK